MGQDDVLEVLKKNKGWMISGEIASILGLSRASVGRTLKVLFKQDKVEKEEIMTVRGRKYLWKHKF